MPARNWQVEGYRYGFNGKRRPEQRSAVEGEFDSEWKACPEPSRRGEGNSYDYGFRVHDPRLGRFLSVDPLAQEYSGFSPYSFTGNTPIIAFDPDGKKIVFVNSEDPKMQALIQKIEQMRVKSELFDAMYTLLDADPKEIRIEFDDEHLDALGADGATSPSGVLHLRSTAGEERANNKPIVEELFHSYQFIFYGISSENRIRSVSEIEVEAKLFDNVVLYQLGTPPTSFPMYEEPFIVDDDLANLIEGDGDKRVDEELLDNYFRYLDYFAKVTAQSNSEVKTAHEYYKGEVRHLKPDAYNEVVDKADEIEHDREKK